MDTVNMLNTMRFYCQPILPLVYDESMSYYETLCKVVGQLNNTGDVVNKLNEGLTNEIRDRQKADDIIFDRLKVLESTSLKIHFLTFAGTPPHSAKPVGTMPTRDELREWVDDGHMIITLLRTSKDLKEAVYAMSCSYNAGNWTNTSEGFNLIVPVDTTYDADKDYAIRQKIAKITIPPESAASLNEDWGLQVIEINTPSTSANGVVNIAANISESGAVNCNLTPFDFKQLYAPAWANKNLCVAINAKLFYDGYTRTSSIATVDSTNHRIRIAFERDNGTYTKNGVKQLNKTLDYLIGDVSQNTWTYETIDFRILDFNRYDGFQFTRGAGNVITTDGESTPNAVWAQYQSDHSGRIYQNLPTRFIDTIDGAEYWNGVFDIKDGKHMTVTFVCPKYDTISDEMHVHMIELSADVDATAWKYNAKVIDLPYRPTSYNLNVWQASETPTITGGVVVYEGSSSLDFDDILSLVNNAQDIVAMLHKGTSEAAPEWSGLVYSSQSVKDGAGSITFATTEGVSLENGIPSMQGKVIFSKDTSGVKKVTLTFSSALPAPSADGSDDGKVPTIVGNKWGLETPSGGSTPGGSSRAVLYVSQTLTDEQKKQARENIDAASDFVVKGTVASETAVTLDKTFEQIKEAIAAGKRAIMEVSVGAGNSVVLSASAGGDTAIMFTQIQVGTEAFSGLSILVNQNGATLNIIRAVTLDPVGRIKQTEMATAPTQDMQIATKKYVDDVASSPHVKDMSSAWNPTVQSSKSGKVVINDKHLFYYPGLDAVYFSLNLIGFEDSDISSTVAIDMNVSAPINGISLLPAIDTAFTAQLFVQSTTGLSPNSAVAPAFLSESGFLGIVLTENSPGGVTSYVVINGWYLANNPSSN